MGKKTNSASVGANVDVNDVGIIIIMSNPDDDIVIEGSEGCWKVANKDNGNLLLTREEPKRPEKCGSCEKGKGEDLVPYVWHGAYKCKKCGQITRATEKEIVEKLITKEMVIEMKNVSLNARLAESKKKSVKLEEV